MPDLLSKCWSKFPMVVDMYPIFAWNYIHNYVHLLLRSYCLDLIVQRQAAQCVGRVIRSKADYGMMIFADKRTEPSARCPKLKF